MCGPHGEWDYEGGLLDCFGVLEVSSATTVFDGTEVESMEPFRSNVPMGPPRPHAEDTVAVDKLKESEEQAGTA